MKVALYCLSCKREHVETESKCSCGGKLFVSSPLLPAETTIGSFSPEHVSFSYGSVTA